MSFDGDTRSMSYLTTFDVPGMTADEYDAVHADALPDGLADGLLLHVATDLGDRMQIIEVWESEDTFDRFIADRFSAVAEEHDLPPLDPTVRGSTHNVVLE